MPDTGTKVGERVLQTHPLPSRRMEKKDHLSAAACLGCRLSRPQQIRILFILRGKTSGSPANSNGSGIADS
jgi:hypothetical protein